MFKKKKTKQQKTKTNQTKKTKNKKTRSPKLENKKIYKEVSVTWAWSYETVSKEYWISISARF